MFFNWLYPLVSKFSILNVLKYLTVRSAYAAITALLFTFLVGPWLIRKLRALKAGQSVRQDGPQSHLSKSGTPTMGGLLMILGIAIAMLLWMDLTHPVTWILMTALLGFGGIGFLDDLLKILARNSRGLPGWFKILGQFVIATTCMVWLSFLPGYDTHLYVPFFKLPVLNLSWLMIPFGIFLMIGWSNAVNVTDGLDGLATGLVILVGISLAAIAYVSGRVDYATYLQIPFNPWGGEVAIFCLALVGAAVGFLWFNGHPAEIFMGDTGSLALGGLFGLLSVLLKRELLLVVLGGVFVMETVSVMIQVFWYKRTKRRVFRMAPLHHHFELSGWAETKVVIRFWLLGGLFAIVGLSTLKLQ